MLGVGIKSQDLTKGQSSQQMMEIEECTVAKKLIRLYINCLMLLYDLSCF